MGRFIVKLHDHYLEWSTIVDAPVTYGMTLDEFKEAYRDEYGRSGAEELAERLERVDRYGTSARDGTTPEQLINFNRAGPDESCLTLEGVYRHYCLGEEIKPEWIVPPEPDEDDE